LANRHLVDDADSQVGALATAAGAGGGALFVPLFNSILEFGKSS